MRMVIHDEEMEWKIKTAGYLLKISEQIFDKKKAHCQRMKRKLLGWKKRCGGRE
jgi:hypothetical protein